MNTVSIRVQKRDGSLVDYDGAEVAASIALATGEVFHPVGNGLIIVIVNVIFGF